LASGLNTITRGIPDPTGATQRAIRALDEAINVRDLRLDELEDTVDGLSVGGGAVSSVAGGSSMITASPITGAVVVNVIPANFTGIPQAGVTGLVADLAGKAPLVHAHDVFTDVDDGYAPASGGGTENFLRADGVWAPPFPAAGTLTAWAQADSDGTTVNLTTEGTFDWYTPWTNTARASTLANFVPHAKIRGGWILSSFEWVQGAAPGMSMLTANASPTKQSSATDTIASVALASQTTAFMSSNNAAAVGFGFRFRVPATPGILRTLRVYTAQFSCEVEARAFLTDNSAAEIVDTFNVAAGTSDRRQWTCTYEPAVACDLVVTVLVKTNNISGTLNIGCGAITVENP
jgi:hypothetical protein